MHKPRFVPIEPQPDCGMGKKRTVGFDLADFIDRAVESLDLTKLIEDYAGRGIPWLPLQSLAAAHLTKPLLADHRVE